MIKKQHEDYTNYPESALRERVKLAHSWIPADCRRLLDGGCAFGYGTRHFKTKAAETWGVDPNQTFIAIAQQRYPNIFFRVCGLEQTSFEAGYFDVIILNDVLEHVVDEQKSLNEMCRILAPGGTFIITTPHRGLFSFMDPDNYVYHIRTKTPRFYRWLYRAKYGKIPSKQIKPGYEQLHRHYNRQDFVRLLNGSDFHGRYEIDRVFRSALLTGVFTNNLYEFLSLFLGIRLAGSLCKPLRWLADKEFFIPFGPMAYSIGIRIKKLK
jgi:ubiquinone/menaquinone biosynthesis C-methylase UbiE